MIYLLNMPIKKSYIKLLLTLLLTQPYLLQGQNLEERISKYDFGAIKSKSYYLNGLKHGTWLNYHKSGGLQTSSEYRNDTLIGPHQMFYSNGVLKEFQTFDYIDGDVYSIKVDF